MKITNVWISGMSWVFKKFYLKKMLKVSAFYLEKQKSFIPKKNIFLAIVNIKTKKLCLLTPFSRRFWSLTFGFLSDTIDSLANLKTVRYSDTMHYTLTKLPVEPWEETKWFWLYCYWHLKSHILKKSWHSWFEIPKISPM